MSKKLLALLLALTMVLAMLSGCGQSTASSVESAASEASEEPAPAPEPDPAPEPEPEPAPEVSTVEESAVEEEPVTYDSMAEKYFAMSQETNQEYKEIAEAVETDISYPLADGDKELTMWRVFSAFIWNGLMNSYADMPTMPLIEEATGVKMKFVEVSDSCLLYTSRCV